MTHVPRDFDDFFRRVGRQYVEKCIRNGSFRGETLRVAREWLIHTDQHLNHRNRLISAGIGLASILATIVAALIGKL